jgi:hypothetical protein
MEGIEWISADTNGGGKFFTAKGAKQAQWGAKK